VATLNGGDRIKTLLSSLERQSLKSFEVIIVDQSEKSILDKIQNFSKLNIRYFKTDEAHLSKARNIGIQNSIGEHIGFPDDDCIYDKNILLKLDNIFRNKKLDFICTGVYSIETNMRLPVTSLKNDTAVNLWNFYKTGTSVGLFMRNSSKKYFDTNFGIGGTYGSSEELDLILRDIILNKKGNYYPSLKVFHPSIDPIIHQDLNKIITRSVGHGAFWRKHIYYIFRNGGFPLILFYVFFIQLAHLFKSLIKLNVKSITIDWLIFTNTLRGFLRYVDLV
jgi:glycosyltransferase involved in cell wall biosynthesis